MKTDCFSNKVERSIVCRWQGKDKVTKIKSLINARVEEALERGPIQDLK